MTCQRKLRLAFVFSPQIIKYFSLMTSVQKSYYKLNVSLSECTSNDKTGKRLKLKYRKFANPIVGIQSSDNPALTCTPRLRFRAHAQTKVTSGTGSTTQE